MNHLQFFNYGMQEVRTILKGDDVWFVAKDVCNILELTNPTIVLQKLDDDERAKFNLGRQGEVNVVNEYGLYSLVMASRKSEAKKFKRWILHEVIPSIRKHGAYMADDVLEQAINNPGYVHGLLTSLENEKQKRSEVETQNKMLRQRIEEYEPKADYFDKVLFSENTLTITQIAKDYKLSAVALNKILFNEKVQYKVNGQWVLYKEYQSAGYAKAETIPRGKTGYTVTHLKWTQKGRKFIDEVLRKVKYN
ncbi:phage antirepressor KilAC domain-containing protein [Domibacillus sp. PGB-M46]|uniref:phage antirepressor n=1 Tax=Domibacillus sp. PGB-M46 TaxID=2910255 RepID=UPI001F59EA7D|nr:phage antirepressor KilAC domain-containing protein [Domibacillus sp. PGB-M46]MCI2253430.1 phage antirepressor KilAC domain-containing protein [Domibacillus sp. PGB-M46]